MQRINNIKRWSVLLTVLILPFFPNAQIDFVHPQDTLFDPVNRLDSVYYLGGKEYRYDYFYSDGAIKKKVFIINDSVRVVSDYSFFLGKSYLRKEYRVVSNKVDGKSIYFYRNGISRSVSIYSNGNRNLTYDSQFYKSGQKRVEFIYDDEFRLKQVKKYNRRGKLTEESTR